MAAIITPATRGINYPTGYERKREKRPVFLYNTPMPFCLSFAFSILAATLVTAPQVASGEFVGKRVALRGVVAAAVHDDLDDGFNWILLKTPEGTVCASSDNRVHPLKNLRRLLDAEVELTGVVRRFVHWRKFLGYQILFDDPARGDGLRVLKPAPVDPFAAPSVSDAAQVHRRTASGTVVAVTAQSFFLRRADGLLRVHPADGGGVPPIGARVAVSGFAERDRIVPQLTEALWRREDAAIAPPEPAEDLAIGRLLKTDNHNRRASGSLHRYFDPALCGKVLRLRGFVEPIPQGARNPRGFRLSHEGESVFVDLSAFPLGDFPVPEAGTEIAIAGLCSAEFGIDPTPIFPRFLGLSLIPRSADDLQILRRAPFWTVRRLVLLLALALFGAAGFAAWSVTLKIVSTRRARQLAREQILGARAELKVEERTRLAVELHDAISQTLTGVALQIDAATGADGAGAKRFLATARNMLASCRQELNGCLWDLRSRTFEEKDLTEAVARTLAPHTGSAKLSVRFNVPREGLSEPTAHAVLRIVRELVVNAVKHGGAKNIKVAGELHDGTIAFSVADDGAGFDPATAPGPAEGHFGLQGIRERLNAFNGAIRCESRPGRGAKFTVTLHASTTETE